ncbi:hypothetical protein TNCV_2667681 [Trichonephila clavipes]|nr:hypothetical protein TNCV_2667681 [Trichonephila clavipes]
MFTKVGKKTEHPITCDRTIAGNRQHKKQNAESRQKKNNANPIKKKLASSTNERKVTNRKQQGGDEDPTEKRDAELLSRLRQQGARRRKIPPKAPREPTSKIPPLGAEAPTKNLREEFTRTK